MGTRVESTETVIIGGGQAGLATGYQLQRRQRPFVILNAEARIGDSWRKRWDSLCLFTPSKHSSLPGMRQPRSGWAFATKDEFADYLEAYAEHFQLDVRSGVRVESIRPQGDRYLVTAGEQSFEADHVVLATGAYQEPHVPLFAPELDSPILQLHSSAYRNPQQLREGPVLVVGGGNSGAEIAVELAGQRDVWLAGSKVPVFPVRPRRLPARVVMPAFLFVATHVLTTSTPMGRRMRANAQMHAAPLVKVKPSDIAAAGVHRVGRVTGIRDGLPLLDDDRVLGVANVIWCTGFRSDFSWIDLPAFASGAAPEHHRGVVADEPGMYLVGQRFQYALSSSFIGGVGRDAGHIATVIAARVLERRRATERQERSDASRLQSPGS